MNNINNSSGWPRKWLPWMTAWKRSKGSYQDSYSSPFFLKKDLFCDNINALEYTTKKGREILYQHKTIYSLDKKSWLLLWKLPVNNREKEITWKFLTNSIASSKRTRHYLDIHCNNCNSPEFNRQHLIADCSLSKKVHHLLSYKNSIFSGMENWEYLWKYKWHRGRIKEDRPYMVIFIIILTELYNNYYIILANQSFYSDHKLIVNNIINRLKDHIKTSAYNSFNKHYISSFTNICNNL